MAATIVWSQTDGGAALGEPVDLGDFAGGENGTAQDIYLRHDMDNSITNAKIYLAAKTGSYTGDFTPAQDLEEILNYGALSNGGLQVNFNASGSFPGGSWTYLSNINGGTLTTALILPTTTGCPTVGVIPAGSTTNVRFRIRLVGPATIPPGEVGVKQVELRLRYTYTS